MTYHEVADVEVTFPKILLKRAERHAARHAYREKEFGLGTAGRKSYRDVKHYRRRKRWLA